MLMHFDRIHYCSFSWLLMAGLVVTVYRNFGAQFFGIP
jgi:hypothetical protein